MHVEWAVKRRPVEDPIMSKTLSGRSPTDDLLSVVGLRRSCFGPWATTLDPESRAGLSTFWKRRMAMLPHTKKSIPQLSRRVSAVLVAVAVCAVALPTVYLSRPTQALAEPSENGASQPDDLLSSVEPAEAAPQVFDLVTAPPEASAAGNVPAAKPVEKAPPAEGAPAAPVAAAAPKAAPTVAPSPVAKSEVPAAPAVAPAASTTRETGFIFREAPPNGTARYVSPDATFELPQKGPPSVEFLPPLSAREKKITATLDDPSDLDFADTPLSDVIDYIKSKHAIEIQLDTKGLAEAGIGISEPVTKSIKDASLRSALRLILGELDLTYLVRDDVLWITSQEKATAMPVTRTYPVADLQDGGTQGGAGGGYEALIKAITAIIDPGTWDSAGGPGSIVAVPPARSIVISHTYATHEKVLELLRALRAARQLDDKHSSSSSTTTPRYEPAR
jgi:hypothetical protein